jgi:hypothetical protein
VRELQTVIEGLAEQLHRAVAIDDPSIRLLAHTAHDEEVDEHRVHSIMTLRAGPEIAEYVYGLGIRTATEPVRIPGRPDLKMLGRVCVPVRCQSLLLGYLWLIDDDETLTEDEIQASITAAKAVGEVLFRERLLDDLRRASERQLLFELISPDPDGQVSVSQSDLDAAGLTERLSCRVVVVHAPFSESGLDTEAGELTLETVLRRSVRKVKNVRSLVATRRGGRGYLLVAFREHDDPLAQLRTVGEAICAELATSLPGALEVIVGIGSVSPVVEEARQSFQRAQGVVDVCRTLHDFAPVAAWEDLGVYRVLQQLPLEELTDVAIPPGLQALLASESDRWLVETLDTYLDAAGNAQESARRLHVHRATLYYRLSRIEALTGMSLADGQDRLALHLGVKLARLSGAVDPHASDDAPDDGRLGS